jgi:hypothetical protein
VLGLFLQPVERGDHAHAELRRAHLLQPLEQRRDLGKALRARRFSHLGEAPLDRGAVEVGGPAQGLVFSCHRVFARSGRLRTRA